jgi:hypothetical protein
MEADSHSPAPRHGPFGVESHSQHDQLYEAFGRSPNRSFRFAAVEGPIGHPAGAYFPQSLDTFPRLMREVAKSKWGVLMLSAAKRISAIPCWRYFQDAWQQGSICVKVASIPQYMTVMTKLHCFRHPQDRVVMLLRLPREKWDQ